MKQKLSSRNLPCCSKKSLGALSFKGEPDSDAMGTPSMEMFRPFDGDPARADRSATRRSARGWCLMPWAALNPSHI